MPGHLGPSWSPFKHHSDSPLRGSGAGVPLFLLALNASQKLFAPFPSATSMSGMYQTKSLTPLLALVGPFFFFFFFFFVREEFYEVLPFPPPISLSLML